MEASEAFADVDADELAGWRQRVTFSGSAGSGSEARQRVRAARR
jgi:hypothetical protein